MYFKLTFKTATNKRRTVWTTRINPPNPNDQKLNRYDFIWFRKVNRRGVTIEPIELIGLTGDDIISIQEARLNLKYNELEIASN